MLNISGMVRDFKINKNGNPLSQNYPYFTASIFLIFPKNSEKFNANEKVYEDKRIFSI